MSKPCETCHFFTKSTGTCSAYTMQAITARAHPMLCSTSGDQHSPRTPRWMIFIGRLVMILLIAAGVAALIISIRFHGA